MLNVFLGVGLFIAGVLFVLLAGNVKEASVFWLLLSLGTTLSLLGTHVGGW